MSVDMKLGTIHHQAYGVSASIHYDAPFKSTLKTRRYMCGLEQPNYPMPAKRTRTFQSLCKLGYVSAENNFPIDVVFKHYIKD